MALALSDRLPSPTGTAARDSYRESGYWVARALFPRDDIERIRLQMLALIELRCGVTIAPDDDAGLIDALGEFLKKDVAGYVATLKLLHRIPEIAALAGSPAMVQQLRGLGLEVPTTIGKPVVHMMDDRLKIPGGYHLAPPHQDWRVTQGSLDGVTVWVPLTPVTESRYPLQIVPGTHKLGLLESQPDPFQPRVDETAQVFADEQYETIEVEPGDAVIFSFFAVHRTKAEGNTEHRLSLSIRYNNANEPTYLERGVPDPYVMKPDHALITPDFPAPGDLERLFATGSNLPAE
ncbi:MAG: phytanoyl-CoA dioxygenase family protein [Alphaproteobacteria bacterium]|nr:phytanoyl-CoA dioxygenase family protein [Alphaproteobacteria bacterium]